MSDQKPPQGDEPRTDPGAPEESADPWGPDVIVDQWATVTQDHWVPTLPPESWKPDAPPDAWAPQPPTVPAAPPEPPPLTQDAPSSPPPPPYNPQAAPPRVDRPRAGIPSGPYRRGRRGIGASYSVIVGVLAIVFTLTSILTGHRPTFSLLSLLPALGLLWAILAIRRGDRSAFLGAGICSLALLLEAVQAFALG